MSDPNDEFDSPKLGDALQAAYTHRAAVPASVDEAIRAAAAERFGRRRRLRLIARWGTGLAAGIAAAIVLIVSLNRPVPLGPVGFDRQMTMVDALKLAKHLAAKESIDKSWDMNRDGVIDQQDIDAVAAMSVNIGPRVLGQHTLPTLEQLGISARHVERSETSGLDDPSQILRQLRMTNTVSLAKPADSQEVPR